VHVRVCLQGPAVLQHLPPVPGAGLDESQFPMTLSKTLRPISVLTMRFRLLRTMFLLLRRVERNP